MERLKFSPNQDIISKTLTTGVTIEAKIELPTTIMASDTANHEAKHVVAAGEIEEASIVPRGNALGITRPKVLTAAAAAAPAADGHDGYGWDKRITVTYLGVNWESALSMGRQALAGKTRLVGLIAAQLDRKGTIYQTDVDKAKQKFEDENNGMYYAFVRIISSDGKIRLIQKKTYQHELKINKKELPINTTGESNKKQSNISYYSNINNQAKIIPFKP